MKKYMLFLMLAVVSVSCNGQKNEDKKLEAINEQILEKPKGNWKVNREFDENGNLIRYDSIYSWSSSGNLNTLSSKEKDSLLNSFKSNFFEDYAHFESQGFPDVFSQDSLFSKHFFSNDFFESSFGEDFMDIEKIRNQMFERQKAFLDKYRQEFIKPEDENE